MFIEWIFEENRQYSYCYGHNTHSPFKFWHCFSRWIPHPSNLSSVFRDTGCCLRLHTAWQGWKSSVALFCRSKPDVKEKKDFYVIACGRLLVEEMRLNPSDPFQAQCLPQHIPRNGEEHLVNNVLTPLNVSVYSSLP